MDTTVFAISPGNIVAMIEIVAASAILFFLKFGS